MNNQKLVLLVISIALFAGTSYAKKTVRSKLRRDFENPVGQLADKLKVAATDEIAYLNEQDANMNKLFEMDIQKTPNFMKMLRKANLVKKDAVTKKTWPGGVVPYKLSRTFGKKNDGKKILREAIIAIQSASCVKFRPYNRFDKHYLMFYHGKGCNSALGKDTSRSYQAISLEHNPLAGRTCLHKGVAIHELLHALGFYHEQSRRDRDTYVKINFKNIKEDMDSQFKMHDLNAADTLGEAYDKQSIMHYGNYAFTKNGEKTVESVSDSNEELGQRNGLSEIDIKQLNKLYKCPKKSDKRDNAASGSGSGDGEDSR